MAIKLSSIDQFEQVIEENKYVFVLKHSETCPISANAYDQFNKFLYEKSSILKGLIFAKSMELMNYKSWF